MDSLNGTIMEKYLFITDFDGTLLNDDKFISDQDLDTLARLRRAGTPTAIATGRSHFSFFRALEQMGLARADLPVDYLIFSTGAGILDLASDEIIRHRSLDRGGVGKICRHFDQCGFDYMIHRAIPHTRDFLYKAQGEGGADFIRRIQMYADFGSPLEDGGEIYPRVTEVLAIVQDGISPDALVQVREALADFSVIHATSPLDHSSSWIEVFHPRVSKSLSTAWLIRELGMAQEGVVSIGNDYNDLDLLAWSGRGFLVDNAPDDLKAGFTTVASNNHSGVSRAVEMAGLL